MFPTHERRSGNRSKYQPAPASSFPTNSASLSYETENNRYYQDTSSSYSMPVSQTTASYSMPAPQTTVSYSVPAPAYESYEENYSHDVNYADYQNEVVYNTNEVIDETTPEVTGNQYDSFVSWASFQSVSTVEACLSTNAYNVPLEVDYHGRSLLLAACAVGNISIVDYWFLNFPYANSTALDNSGKSALHLACENGHEHIVRQLITNYNFDPYMTCANGVSPIMYATKSRHISVILYLLTIAPKCQEVSDNNGMTPFLYSCYNGDMNVTHLLCSDPNTNIHLENNDGLNCFSLAAIYGHLDTMIYLCSLDISLPSIHATNQIAGRNCLHYACEAKQYHIIKYLVRDLKMDYNIPDKNAITPANIDPADDIISYILGYGGNSTVANKDNNDHKKVTHATPQKHSRETESQFSQRAALYESSNTSNNVVENKSVPPTAGIVMPSAGLTANVSTSSRTFKKEIPAVYVPPSNPSFLPPKSSPGKPVEKEKKQSSEIHEKVLNKLKQKEALPSVSWIKETHNSTYTENDAATVIAKSKGVDSDSSANDTNKVVDAISSVSITSNNTSKELDEPLIMKLIEYARIGAVGELEDILGSDPNINYDVRTIRDASNGMTLLHYSCKAGDLATAQYLLEGVGADVNATDSLGMTSLHYAAIAHHVLIVRYLIKYCGADLDIANNEGKKVLDLMTDDTSGSSDAEEIVRTITKAVGKSPEKRTKITFPVFQKH